MRITEIISRGSIDQSPQPSESLYCLRCWIYKKNLSTKRPHLTLSREQLKVRCKNGSDFKSFDSFLCTRCKKNLIIKYEGEKVAQGVQLQLKRIVVSPLRRWPSLQGWPPGHLATKPSSLCGPSPAFRPLGGGIEHCWNDSRGHCVFSARSITQKLENQRRHILLFQKKSENLVLHLANQI